ncbi:MAG: hypothetical protein WA799_04625 [Nitrosotalea sp.]
MPILDLYRSGLNISSTYYTLARVLGNAGLILDKRPKNKPTLTSTGKGLVEVECFEFLISYKMVQDISASYLTGIGMAARKTGKHMRKADQRAARRKRKK